MKRRAGYAVIELPSVILFLGLALLAATIAIYRYSGRFAWFLLVPGGLFVALAIVMLILIYIGDKRSEN